MNKIGDSGLLICFSLIFLCIKTIDFSAIFSSEFIFSLSNIIGISIEENIKSLLLKDGLTIYTDLKFPISEYTGFLHFSQIYSYDNRTMDDLNYIFLD